VPRRAPLNRLFFGDNLQVLRDHIEDESIDLIYLDPPFKSGQGYKILFNEHDGTIAAAQIQAFEDTWEWTIEPEPGYVEVVQSAAKVSQVMQALRTFLGPNTTMAYLAMMAPRLVEFRGMLKQMGSIYLRCDPTASHCLKSLLDAVFSPQYCRNESLTPGSHSRRAGRVLRASGAPT
jgi:site-specific DNA-methyltransferase (adenine-specific)